MCNMVSISGSGYLTACMAEMVGKNGKVVGIDHLPELVEQSKRNMKNGNADLLASGQVVLVTGDGREGFENGERKSISASSVVNMIKGIKAARISTISQKKHPMNLSKSSHKILLDKSIECVHSCDQLPYLHTETKGRIFIKIGFNSQKNIIFVNSSNKLAAVSLFHSSNVAAVTSYEITLLGSHRVPCYCLLYLMRPQSLQNLRNMTSY